jgi:hypothetical protein
MALSKVSYIGNGVTQSFSLTFNFLNRSHVKVFVNGVENTTFTWATNSTITITPAPPNGSIVVIQRQTPTTPIVDFVDGSNLTEVMLDTATRQSIFIAEENRDESTEVITLDTATDSYLFGNKRIAQVANPINAQDVVTKGYLDTTYLNSLLSAVSSASASASTATTQAGIATTQAGIATTQAEIATAKANEASGYVSTIEGLLAGLVKATQAQAEAGTNDTAYMTPLKTKQAIDALAPLGGFSNIQVFTASGTFTVPAGITKVKATVVGGGGNGGLGSGSGATGGGGGGTAIGIFTVSPSSSHAVTVGGAGGTSSFGSLCSATGGASGVTGSTNAGGLGGIGTGGQINIRGGTGSNTNNTSIGGEGAGSYLGGSSGSAEGASSARGGSQYGGGAQGGNLNSPSGGTGASGVVIVEW